MATSRFTSYKKVYDITTDKSEPTTTDFAKGINTYKPNDKMDYNQLYLAQDARFERVGEYVTRKGLTRFTEPCGMAKMYDTFQYQIPELTTLDQVEGQAYTLEGIEPTERPIVAMEIIVRHIKRSDTDYGVIRAELIADDKVVATTCFDPDETLAADTGYRTVARAYFVEAPVLKGAEKVQVRFSLQSSNSKEVYCVGAWGVPPGSKSPVGKKELPQIRLFDAEPGKVCNIFEVMIDGTSTVLFVQNNKIYRAAEDGTTTLIRQIPGVAKNVRFCQNTNVIRYADGIEGPRKITPVSADNWVDESIKTIDLTTGEELYLGVSNIMDGTEDNLVYFDAITSTQAIWGYPYGQQYARTADYTSTTAITAYNPDASQPQNTTIARSALTAVSSVTPVSKIAAGHIVLDSSNHYGIVTSVNSSSVVVKSDPHVATAINSYDYFDRDFRQNFPAILTGDPLTAMFNLGGVLYFMTRKNKYYMISQTADTWTQGASNAQNGTYSQESIVCDLNFAYYANDNGIFVFDGSSEYSITSNTIQNVYDAIPTKDSIVLDMYNNRLYVFYASTAGGDNDSCLVYNTSLGLWESFDTGAFVSATCGRKSQSGRLIVGHSKVGMLMIAEDNNNKNDNLGAPLHFELDTAYIHFGAPSQTKRITKWRPEFSKTERPYNVACGYAVDFTDNVKYAYSINLENLEKIQDNYAWEQPGNYHVPVTPTKLTTQPIVQGDFRRCQIRYQHYAAFEPVNFKSHTLTVQTQRVR